MMTLSTHPPVICLRVALIALALALATFSSKPAVTEEDGITAGDKLLISIPGTDPPEQEYVVDPAGNIDLGIHGKVRMAGMPVKDAQKQLQKYMSQYLTSVRSITVLLRQSRRTVFVTGCVSQPGLVMVDATDDLWKAIHSAGGPAPCADLSRVIIFRNEKRYSFNLRAFLTRDSTKPPPILRAGDTIMISAQPGMALSSSGAEAFLGNKAIDRKVFVIGEVRSPGIFDRSSDLDVLTAVALADGPTEIADLSHTVLMTKDTSYTVDLQGALRGTKRLHKKLLPGRGGAIIYVPSMTENTDTRLGEHINVIGPFMRTGRIPISGPIKLSDAIGLVGGPTNYGKLGDVRVIEDAPRFTLSCGYDMKKYYRSGGWLGRIPVNPGSTVIIGRNHMETVQNTISIISSLAMISTAVAMWATFAQAPN